MTANNATPSAPVVPDEGYPGIAHDFESCKAMLREALKYIGECPHHVFKDPRKVVDFYERATRTVQP